MSNITKLAYAYGSLMAKTAGPGAGPASAGGAAPAAPAPTKREKVEALELEQRLRAAMQKEKEYKDSQKGGYLDQMGKYFTDPANRDKIINRAAIGTTGLALSGGMGALGASEAANRLRDAGFSSQEIRDTLSVGGGALRGAGKAAVGAGAGFGLGYGAGALYNYLQEDDDDKVEGLESMLGTLGGLGGAATGTALGYSGELDRADEAIAGRELDRIMNAARKGKKYKSKVLI